MSERWSRYLSSDRAPSEATSRIQKWLACASSFWIASTHCTTSASEIGAVMPGTRCTPSSTVDQPSASERSMAAFTPTSTFRVWSRNPCRSGATSSASAQRAPGLEDRVVDRRHELGAEEGPQRLADEVRRRDAGDSEPVGDLGRDRGLTRARRAADEDDERQVDLGEIAEAAQPADGLLALVLAEHVLGELLDPVELDRVLLAREQLL